MTVKFARMISVIMLLVLWGTSVPAQMAGYQKLQNINKKHTPQFEDFPADEESHSLSATVDLSSHPLARMFRTKLREGAKKGPSFAGHYALVWWGCGNECQLSLIVDLRTGKVYGFKPPNNQYLQSSRGLDFRPTSRLIIADPPCPENYNPCVSSARSGEPVRYYLMQNNGIKLIHKTPCRLVDERQQCGD